MTEERKIELQEDVAEYKRLLDEMYNGEYEGVDETFVDTDEIIDWYDDEGTAVCPYCYIDSVIGKSSGYEITEEFLMAMEDYFFGLRKRRFRYEDGK